MYKVRLISTLSALTLAGLSACNKPSPPAAQGPTETPGAAAAGSSSVTRVVDAGGNLRVPEDYRSTYQHLGSWSIGADAPAEGAKEIHDVWASPGLAAAYKATGHFPEGGVLVKEVFETATGSQTTGPVVSHEQKLKGWFVMVRDSKNTHPGNPLWGDGWGWSWFDADKPTKTTSTDYTADCKGCHIPAQKTDWIYVQGYPVLAR